MYWQYVQRNKVRACQLLQCYHVIDSFRFETASIQKQDKRYV